MLSFDAALALVVDAAAPLGSETVALAQAHGRVLSAPALAAIDSPRAAVSTMDGYAVGGDHRDDGWTVVGTAFPGEPFGGTLGDGQALRVHTGAPLPAGADRVLIQENIRRDGDHISWTGGDAATRWVRAAASDCGVGDMLLPFGHRIDARALVTLAGGDVGQVTVWRRPRICVLASGSELVTAGLARASPYAVPDSLSIGLAALSAEWGALVTQTARVADDGGALLAAVEAAAADVDVVILTGGASVGDRDFTRAIQTADGYAPLFAKVAMKPGKPVWMGRSGACWIVGLPGNPTSAMVTARLLLAPLLLGLGGGDWRDAHCWRDARLAGAVGAAGERELFTRGRIGSDGRVTPLANQDSGAQSPLARSDCLIRSPAGQAAIPAGEALPVLDWHIQAGSADP